MIARISYLFVVFSLFFSGLFPRAAWAAPEVSAEAAVLMDMESGQILYQKNMDKRMYPASTTKMMTGLIAIRKGDFKDRVKVSREAVLVGGSSVGLQEDEVLTLEDLLYALLLPSSNDAGFALAEHIGGSVEEFVRAMNSEAQAMGALNTHFANPHGLHDPNHYSTARDLAIIAREAMKNSAFRKIVGTYHYKTERFLPRPVNGIPQVDFVNLNKLMWPGFSYEYPGITGVKTGYTDEARRCLVSSAKRNGRELLSVVMKTENSGVYQDSVALLNYGFNEFRQVVLVDQGSEVARAKVQQGESEDIGVVTSAPFHFNVPVNDTHLIEKKINIDGHISAPVSKGQKVGTMYFTRDGKTVGSIDLLSDRDVDKSPFFRWWYGPIVLGLIYFTLRYKARARRRRYMLRKRRWG